MAESDELLRGVKKLEAVQQYHSHVLELLLRVQDQERLRADILPLLTRAQVFKVFVAVDGVASGVEIAQRTGVPQPTVSRYLACLAEHGLIKLVDTGQGGAKIYAKTPTYQILNLESYLPANLVNEYTMKRRRSPRKDI